MATYLSKTRKKVKVHVKDDVPGPTFKPVDDGAFDRIMSVCQEAAKQDEQKYGSMPVRLEKGRLNLMAGNKFAGQIVAAALGTDVPEPEPTPEPNTEGVELELAL